MWCCPDVFVSFELDLDFVEDVVCAFEDEDEDDFDLEECLEPEDVFDRLLWQMSVPWCFCSSETIPRNGALSYVRRHDAEM